MVSFESFTNSVSPLSDELMEIYRNEWEEFECPKKTILTSEGQIERYIYFVKEGIQKSYYVNEKGKQHVIAFTYSPSLSGIPESFITQTPSCYFLECISDSSFLRISYNKNKVLLEKYWAIETLFRKTLEFVMVGALKRHHELMALSIKERFEIFVKRSPHLLNMISQKDLASYLNIDPTNFSKLINTHRI